MKIQVKIMIIPILIWAILVISCCGSIDRTPLTVTYNGNTNTGGIVPVDAKTYLPTFAVTVLDNGTLTKTGYTFAGWNTQADGNGTDRAPAAAFAIGSSNVVLYAKWTLLPTYTVTYNANGGSGGLPADSNSYLTGATVTVQGNGTLTMAGYSFTCWNTQADGNGTDRAPAATFAMGSANVTLYAKWTALPTYTVTYNANGGSGGLPSDTNSYLTGATATVLSNGTLTNPGYAFAGWNTQADGNGTDRAPAATFVMGSSNVTLYAVWTALPTYTVTYNANGGRGGLPADSNSYLAGATVHVLLGTLTYPMSGNVFAGWNTQQNGSGTTTGPTFVMGSSNVVLYAMWQHINCPVNMIYSAPLSSCKCSYNHVMQNGSCQLCPTKWIYNGSYYPSLDYWMGGCICIKSKTNSCSQ